MNQNNLTPPPVVYSIVDLHSVAEDTRQLPKNTHYQNHFLDHLQPFNDIFIHWTQRIR